MIATLLAVAGIASVLSLLGLLVAGARWRHRTGPLAGMFYFASVVALVFVAAPLLVGARHGELLLASGAAFSVMAATGRLRPDWNPAGQGFLGSLALTCGTFVASAAAYAFSAPLSVLAQVASVGLVVLECFAMALLLVGTHEVLDVIGLSVAGRPVSRRLPAVSTPGRRRAADRRATPAPVRARPTPDRETPSPTVIPTPQSARPTATPTPPPNRPAATLTPPPNQPTTTPTPPPSRPVATPTPPPNRPTATPTPPPTPKPTATPTPHH